MKEETNNKKENFVSRLRRFFHWPPEAEKPKIRAANADELKKVVTKLVNCCDEN